MACVLAIGRVAAPQIANADSMATPPTLDITALLTPVSGDQPAGPELRHASDRNVAKVYFSVRDARKKAIDAERRLRDFASMTDDERRGHPDSPEAADWHAVRRYAIEALTQSKDLWITAWLIEGLTRLHGFAGLRDGVRLAHQLCDGFWQDIHPQATKEQDLATRFAQLAGLDGGSTSEGTLIAPVINLPITAARTVANFSLADYKDAVELERKPPEIRLRRIEQGALTIDMFNQAVAETSVESFRTLVGDVEGASQALVDFNASLREKEEVYKAAGGNAFVPPTSNIREALDECLRLCRASAKDMLDESPISPPPGTVVNSKFGNETQQLGGVSVETRQEAFQTLLRVSEYFRRTEPHSPISYALEQAVRWGRMSLPELLSELVSDKSTREEIFRRAGINQEPGE
jgi:type VI secretion system protein ImpA